MSSFRCMCLGQNLSWFYSYMRLARSCEHVHWSDRHSDSDKHFGMALPGNKSVCDILGRAILDLLWWFGLTGLRLWCNLMLSFMNLLPLDKFMMNLIPLKVFPSEWKQLAGGTTKHITLMVMAMTTTTECAIVLFDLISFPGPHPLIEW